MKRPWFRQCENPRCPQRGDMWKTLLDTHHGVLLHNRWFCSPGCLDQVLAESLSPLIENTRSIRETKSHRFPLGLMMLSLGLINNESLQRALRAQQDAGKGHVGYWLQQLGVVTEPDITRVVAMQWSLPVYPVEKLNENLTWAHLLPRSLLEGFHMLPVHCTPAHNLLHVAFSYRVDYTVLYAIEQILDCRTEACIIQESYIQRALALLSQEGRSTDELIEGPIDASTISRETMRLAMDFATREIRVAGCANNIWIRLRGKDSARDLLFRWSGDESTRSLKDSPIV